MKILAIESSCDETSAAIVTDGTMIESVCTATSSSKFSAFGGIVPEIAAREQLAYIIPTVDQALAHSNTQIDTIDAVAVSIGPGLIGSLLIGVEAAKTISYVTKKPLIPVNHVLAHMYANYISHENHRKKTIRYPAISLVVSGGHTELFLLFSEQQLSWIGGTIDDAAGEAFDKAARLLGFGNRGGAAIQEAAKQHEKTDSITSISLPRPLIHDNSLNFSFSGLKTAIIREWNSSNTHESWYIHELAFEIQEAIVDVCIKKIIQAAQIYHASDILISGGVASNDRLRSKIMNLEKNYPFQVHIPDLSLCTDSAAYIGSYAFFHNNPLDWHTITAHPTLSVEVNRLFQ